MSSRQKRVRDTLSPGTLVLNGRYEIQKVIHSKGMSAVYLVLDKNLKKQWCLKEIRKSDAGKDNVEYDALLQEANIMKSLNHPSIPRITTIEEEGDSLFIVMDYVDGMSIKAWLAKKGKINQEVVVVWMKQITQVMMYLHNRTHPIFYRDMKPDNVMIQSDGNIKVLDFGISLVLTELDMKIEKALGTKGYAAPEQSKRGNVCDLRSDIYAMGKTMYYMLTGINPSQVPKGKLKPVREIDSSISVGLEYIVNKCTEENPDDRFQSCEELYYALQDYTSLDDSRRRSMKIKVFGVLALLIMSVALMVGSLIPLGMYNSQLEENYNRQLAVANQSGRVSDYLEALKLNQVDITPYLGLVDAIKVDGVFSTEEEAELLEYLNTNLDTLRGYPEYGELAYNIGKLYWFYYESDTNDGDLTSVKWFEDAMELGYEPELANVYYQLGSFKRNIAVSITESSDGGMYREYWDNLLQAKEVDSGELITLQLNLTIANCISAYTFNLYQDGVSYEEITTEVNSIKDYLKNYTPSIEKAIDMYEDLKLTVDSLDLKIRSIYGNGGIEDAV